MKTLTIREVKILKLLLKQDGYLPVRAIADSIEVSVKTIYRELLLLDKILEKEDVTLVRKTGLGVSLTIPNGKKTIIEKDILCAENEEVVPSMFTDIRRTKIASYLLSESPKPTSINKLSREYFVSNSSIVNDLNEIEKVIETYQLKLIRSKTGTYIKGNETNIRRTMMYLISHLIRKNEKEEVKKTNYRIDALTYEELVKHFGVRDVKFVQQLVDQSENLLGYSIGDPYYINILTHLLILIRRLLQGEITFKKHPLDNKTELDEGVFEVSQNIKEEIEEEYNMLLPEEEVYYIYQYLASSGMAITSLNDDFKGLINQSDNQVNIVLNETVNIFSSLIDTDLTKDNLLHEKLLIHLKPMLNRIKFGLSVKNPLVEDIKQSFPEVYDLTSLSILMISKTLQLNDVNPDEIATLSIHFQSAIEKTIQKKRILVVCSSGVGTSHLVKTRILQAFPNWEIISIIPSNRIAKELEKCQVDLIISTVKLEEVGVPIVHVTALFNQNDIKNVTETMLNQKLKGDKFNDNIQRIKLKFIQFQNQEKSTKTSILDLLNQGLNETSQEKLLTEKEILTGKLSTNDYISYINSRNIKKSNLGLIISRNENEEIKSLNWIVTVPTYEEGLEILKLIYQWYHFTDFRSRILEIRSISNFKEFFRIGGE